MRALFYVYETLFVMPIVVFFSLDDFFSYTNGYLCVLCFTNNKKKIKNADMGDKNNKNHLKKHLQAMDYSFEYSVCLPLYLFLSLLILILFLCFILLLILSFHFRSIFFTILSIRFEFVYFVCCISNAFILHI